MEQMKHEWPNPQPGTERYQLSAPKSLDDLDFERKPMVGWFKPNELAKAGVEAVISTVFGAYADKRDVESVLAPAQWHDYSEALRNSEDGLWLDYVADLGDGWDSTYTVARLLAEEELHFDDKRQGIPRSEESPTKTKRGQILVMGGDQVYPTASREEYTNRTIEPYRCALPFVTYEEQAPHLYLIPGNHDWYDGLNSFLKLFCQKNWIGGWRTVQSRSYFALKLGEKLWFWGIDIQLNADIDRPQLDYFDHVASEEMQPGSRIILCTAEPTWVFVEAKNEETNAKKVEKKKEDIYNNLAHLEKYTIKKYQHEIVIGVAGDWHNYTRYEATDGSKKQRFVSGGGGAYLYPTHNMPAKLTLPKVFGGEQYQRITEGMFPSEKDSKRLLWRSLAFPFSKRNWWFSIFLGAFFALLAWNVQSISEIRAGEAINSVTLLDKFSDSFAVAAFFEVIVHSPGSITLLVFFAFGLIAFSDFQSMWKKVVHGGVHALLHLCVFLSLVRLFSWINLAVLPGLLDAEIKAGGAINVLLFGIEMLLIGSMLAGMVFGFYLWASNRILKVHDNEVLLCQSNPDYKNFLRFHIKKGGEIDIFPVGVKRVSRKWKLQSDAEGGAPWFEPQEGTIHGLASLIEDKIVYRST